MLLEGAHLTRPETGVGTADERRRRPMLSHGLIRVGSSNARINLIGLGKKFCRAILNRFLVEGPSPISADEICENRMRPGLAAAGFPTTLERQISKRVGTQARISPRVLVHRHLVPNALRQTGHELRVRPVTQLVD